MDSAKGTVTYCQGKDTSGNAHYMIDQFNKKYSSQGLTAKLTSSRHRPTSSATSSSSASRPSRVTATCSRPT